MLITRFVVSIHKASFGSTQTRVRLCSVFLHKSYTCRVITSGDNFSQNQSLYFFFVLFLIIIPHSLIVSIFCIGHFCLRRCLRLLNGLSRLPYGFSKNLHTSHTQVVFFEKTLTFLNPTPNCPRNKKRPMRRMTQKIKKRS